MDFYREIRGYFSRFWKFLGRDTWQSWVIAIILAYLIVRFLFFPLLMFAFGSPMPLVVVESPSMSHPGGFFGDTFGTKTAFDKWWNLKGTWYINHGIYKDQAAEWPMRTGLEKGDIVAVYGRGEYKVGDIIVFNAGYVHPIIHRIVKITEVEGEKIYATKGDNNERFLDGGIEESIKEANIIGKAVFKIPKLGWPKLWIACAFQSQEPYWECVKP